MRARYYLLLCALLLTACSAWAQAPGTYAHNSNSTCTTTGVTATITVNLGQLVVVSANSNAKNDTFTITDSASQSYSTATGPTSSTGGTSRTTQISYFANSAALTSVKITSVSGLQCWLEVAAYSNMATSGSLDVANSRYNSTGGTTCTSPSVTTTNASDVIVGTCDSAATNTFTAGITGTCSNTVTLQDSTATTGLQDCNTTATGSFSTNIGLATSHTSIGAIAAFKQAAAVTCPKTLLTLGVGC